MQAESGFARLKQMRNDLDHLPPQKQRELERVVQLIFEEFDDAFALATNLTPRRGISRTTTC